MTPAILKIGMGLGLIVKPKPNARALLNFFQKLLDFYFKMCYTNKCKEQRGGFQHTDPMSVVAFADPTGRPFYQYDPVGKGTLLQIFLKTY